MPFAIHSNPPKPKKASKKLKTKLEEDGSDTKTQSKSKPPPFTKKIGEISICCDDEFNEDNN